MTRPDAVVRSSRVLVGDDDVAPASIVISAGRIAGVVDWNAKHAAGTTLHDFGEAVVMPGLVDTHVHINEPGRTEWEGFASATRAAAAGGITTLLDMPLNSIPATTSVAALERKRGAAGGQCWVNVGLLGGVVPGNAADIIPLWDAGVFGFKSFLSPSGVDEFPHVTLADLDAALPIIASLGAVLMVHAESPDLLQPVHGDRHRYANYLASRPDAAETEAVRHLIALSERHGARIHVVHLSSGGSLPLLDAARRRGIPVTCETCPHYLSFSAEEIPDGATLYKCAPPIRDAGTRAALWEAIGRGGIDGIVSDHSPCPPEMKESDSGDFDAAWGGIASLQLGLPAVWSGANAAASLLSIGRIAALMSTNPAKLAGLSHRKGRIATGFDADLVAWTPEHAFAVDPARLFHRHHATPYSGRTLHGVVEATLVGGDVAYLRGALGATPHGQLMNARDP